MGLFSRLNTALKANLNSLLDAAEDPDKMIGQTIVDMEQAAREARQDMVKALGTAKRLHKEADEIEETARGWEDKAVLALQNGDEGLAREALKRKAKAEKEAESIRGRANREHSNVEGMKSTLDDVEEKIKDLKARQHSLAADVRRARQAPSTEPAGLASSSRFGSKAFDDLDRMATNIDQMEAEAEVADALRDGPSDADIDARFRALERRAQDDDVEDALSALKSKLDQ